MYIWRLAWLEQGLKVTEVMTQMGSVIGHRLCSAIQSAEPRDNWDGSHWASARAVPFARAWSEAEPSRLRGPPVAVSFANGKGSAYLRSWKFPGAFRQGSSLTTGERLHRLMPGVEVLETCRYSRPRYWLLTRAASNSSPFCQPMRCEKLAASQPSAKPKRAIAESPVKSISGRYSSLGW